ncbi:BCCT family transporter [Natranaerofaba carboxydovora]|uniref:BCCT family transporter n=1 Tax=Natranaerofaba carboxydovora TaxID=2742683 RepID=UPI001F133B1E|nr:BCCT family transporter [Natranaerofaba carboxydovora]UMZ74174.1 Glycine betaine/proline betaine transporter BetS [Natranaerofaba carboxydovora]
MKHKISQEKLKKRLYSRNINKFGFDLNPFVFIFSTSFIIFFSLYAFLNLEHAGMAFNMIKSYVITNFDWILILSSNFFIVVCIFLAISKLGSVKIGGLDSEPEFSNFSWYSMLISAGMGIGLMFWAVGEPLFHFTKTPPIFESQDAPITAMATTFLHWGLHPWGVYALIALSLSFFTFNKNMPLSLRSAFYHLLKDRVYGIPGDLIDTLAIIATLFGLATSLGLGILQINSGLNYLVGLSFSVVVQVILIMVITLFAIISVATGLSKGVRILSEINIKLAVLFVLAIFILGPSSYIIELLSNSFGLYFNDIVKNAFFISSSDKSWQAEWTVFYLSWWISWSPFVGMFIARISKGRTVRELILGVLIVPSLLSFIWLTTLGGTSIYLNKEVDGSLFNTVQDSFPLALFEMIDILNMPFLAEILRTIIFVLVISLVVSYFITSSDSGSLVASKISSGGKIDSPLVQRIFWAVLEGLIAATLLIIGGEKALFTLQTAVISTGLPLSIIFLIMTYSLIKGLTYSYEKQFKAAGKK